MHAHIRYFFVMEMFPSLIPVYSKSKSEKKIKKRRSLNLDSTLELLDNGDTILAGQDFDLDSSQWKYYTWEIPEHVSFDFAFYKQFFLNIDNLDYNVTALDCILCFARLSKLLGLSLSPRSVRALLETEEDDESHTIMWSRFALLMKSYEERLKFTRTRRNKLGAGGVGLDHGGGAKRPMGQDQLDLTKETLIVLTPLERIYFILEGDNFSKWRFVVAFIRGAATVISVGGLILESIPSFRSTPDCPMPPCLGEPTGARIFEVLQLVTLFIFLVDYTFKFVACGFVRHELMNRWDIVTMGVGRSKFEKPTTFWQRFFKFVLSPLALAEAAAVWPSFFRWIIVGLSDSSLQTTLTYDFFRSLRILTLLKVLKLTSLKDITYILARAMVECIGALFILIMVLCMIVLFLCILACVPESGTWYPRGAIVPGGLISLGSYYRPSYLNPNIYEQSPFYSIPASYWWGMMNIAGYGDLVPTTPWGRLIGLLIALIGISILSLPIAIISEAFGSEYERFHGIKRMLKANRMIEVQQRMFDRITRDIGDDQGVSGSSAGSVAEETQSSVKNDDSVDNAEEDSPPVETRLDRTGDVLEDVLMPKLRAFADEHEAWGTIIGRVESLKVKLGNGSLRNRNIYEFVNAATALINESNLPPSPTSSSRSQSSKLVYEIATYFVDKLKPASDTNIIRPTNN